MYFTLRLHRLPKHLLDFLLAELGTSGSVDGNNQLIIKGRFQQKQIENVLRRYIKEYVTCHTCRSPDTILQKDTRLFFLQCETCGSRCSVASIKSGFQVTISLGIICCSELFWLVCNTRPMYCCCDKVKEVKWEGKKFIHSFSWKIRTDLRDVNAEERRILKWIIQK